MPKFLLAAVLALTLATDKPPPPPPPPPSSRVTVVTPAIVAPGEGVNLRAPRGFTWTLRDTQGVVASGVSRRDMRGSAAQIRLPGPGYFEADVTDDKGSSTFALAALTPYKAATPRFGVMTHFAHGWPPALASYVSVLGVGQVRDEAYWGYLQKQPGVMRTDKRVDGYMAALKQHDLQPLIIMSFGNKLYDDGQAPTSPEGIAAFARYSAYAWRTYGSNASGAEVWNEYNGAFCKGPCEKDRPGNYAKLLAQTHAALKAADPNVKVVGGVTVDIPLGYWRKLFALGALDHMDVVSIHPYSGDPEEVYARVLKLRAAMVKAGGEKPIWATEVGRKFRPEEDRAKLAPYVLKMTGLLTAAGVERSYWYLLKDYRGFRGMGLIRGPGDPRGENAPTPGFVAYGVAVRQLDRAVFVRKEALSDNAWVLRFTRDGQPLLLVWSRDGAAVLNMEAGGDLTRTGWTGKSTTLARQNAQAQVIARRTPFFISGPIGRVSEASASAAGPAGQLGDQPGKAPG